MLSNMKEYCSGKGSTAYSFRSGYRKALCLDLAYRLSEKGMVIREAHSLKAVVSSPCREQSFRTNTLE